MRMPEVEKAAITLVEQLNSETGYEAFNGEPSIGQVMQAHSHLENPKDFLIAVLVALSEGMISTNQKDSS